ncbi:MAG: hypothetical protein ACI8PZ_002687 [Myxococcota bacterium]|jgi:hypothetical protein
MTTPRLATLLFSGLWILACANPLDQARTLAEAGETAEALAAVQAVLAESPGDPVALEALGDVHLMAMGGPDGDPEHARAAAAAYAKGAEGQRLPGVFKAKEALALRLAGEEGVSEAAERAVACCRTYAALPFVDTPGELARTLSAGTWAIDGPWRGVDGFDGGGGHRLVVKADGPALTALDAWPTPSLLAGHVADVDALGPPVRFTDRATPHSVGSRGYLAGHDHCDQPYEGFTCRGRMVRDNTAAVHVGPCWHAEEPPEGDTERIPADEIRWNSVHCVAGKPRAQGENCPDAPGSCEVEFERVVYARLTIDPALVWLVPADIPSPADALLLAGEVSGSELQDRLVAGELSLGMPEPLVRWAARATPDAAPDAFRLSKGSVTLEYVSPRGRFTFTDGVLTAWE